MYYQGKVRPVYYQGEVVNNPCQKCANNQYNAFGEEETCNACKEYVNFHQRTTTDEAIIKILEWLKRRGVNARRKKNWPYFKIDR